MIQVNGGDQSDRRFGDGRGGRKDVLLLKVRLCLLHNVRRVKQKSKMSVPVDEQLIDHERWLYKKIINRFVMGV